MREGLGAMGAESKEGGYLAAGRGLLGPLTHGRPPSPPVTTLQTVYEPLTAGPPIVALLPSSPARVARVFCRREGLESQLRTSNVPPPPNSPLSPHIPPISSFCRHSSLFFPTSNWRQQLSKFPDELLVLASDEKRGVWKAGVRREEEECCCGGGVE